MCATSTRRHVPISLNLEPKPSTLNPKPQTHEEACADIPHSKYLLVRGHSDVSHQHLEAMLYNTDEHKLSFVLFFRV